MTVHLLKSTLTALESEEDLSQECRDWLLSGLAQYYLRGKDLEELLGLRIHVPPGGHYLQPLEIEKQGSRNEIIHDLAALLPGINNLERSEVLATMILRYPVGTSDHGKAAKLLINQLMNGAMKPPGSAKQIQRILERDSIPDRVSSRHRLQICVRDPFQPKVTTSKQ